MRQTITAAVLATALTGAAAPIGAQRPDSALARERRYELNDRQREQLRQLRERQRARFDSLAPRRRELRDQWLDARRANDTAALRRLREAQRAQLDQARAEQRRFQEEVDRILTPEQRAYRDGMRAATRGRGPGAMAGLGGGRMGWGVRDRFDSPRGGRAMPADPRGRGLRGPGVRGRPRMGWDVGMPDASAGFGRRLRD